MLDWLSNAQQTSSAAASQIMDAPQTPAPLFAYRALRSVLFGSYDSEESDENEKESIPLEVPSGKMAMNLQEVPLEPQSSTPQRPTPRRMLSPAKSILRTPGLPTPRRQNVSVKFKDIKQTSMELATMSKRTVIEEKPTSLQTKLPSITCPELNASAKSTTVLSQETVTADSDPQPETYYNVNEIHAYIAATEREMKKLVRYGQRMREYARLSQKENAALKKEVDNLKKENEALRHGKHSSISLEKAGQDGDNAGLFDLSPSSTYPPKAAVRKYPQDRGKATNNTVSETGQDQPSRRTLDGMSKKQPSPELRNGKRDDDPAPLQKDTAASPYRASAQSPRASNYARVASRTKLHPDRLAAAKARLRVKSEERKKALSMVGKMEKEDHGSGAVNWQDL